MQIIEERILKVIASKPSSNNACNEVKGRILNKLTESEAIALEDSPRDECNSWPI